MTVASTWSLLRRWTQLVAGLAGYAIAIVLMIRSGLGLGPWDAFHVGLHRLTGISVGTASVLVGLGIVAGSWFIGVRPGPGTLANMLLIGIFIDLLLPTVPPAPSPSVGYPYHLAGILLTGFATGMYIAPGLGKGPRDGLVLGISDASGWSVRRVRTLIELAVLALGSAMGARVGIGTLLFAFGIGPVTQWSLQHFSDSGRAGSYR